MTQRDTSAAQPTICNTHRNTAMDEQERKARAITTSFLLLVIAALAIACLTSCTYYRSPEGHTYVSTANRGYTTNKIGDNQSTSQGITGGGLLDFATNDTTSAFEAMQPATLNIGGPNGYTSTGIVDHSTWVDTAGNWTWRVGRSIITGKVLGSLVDWFKADDLAGHATDQASIASAEAVDINAADNAAAAAQAAADAEAATAALEAAQ